MIKFTFSSTFYLFIFAYRTSGGLSGKSSIDTDILNPAGRCPAGLSISVSIERKPTFCFSALEIERYAFRCLDGCQCDTDDEVIYCHNGARTALHLPESRLRGFTVIGMLNNAIKKLPEEKTILEKFPDLKAIDVEDNKPFDCESLKGYNIIKIYSDCEGNDSIIIRGQKLPDIEEVTDMLKKKYNEMDKEKVVQDVQDFFSNIVKKVKELQQ
ncbi:unnamed protein product [Thelazia callipaeda]|uniref:LRRNT domain-containing protein n=1 Tax=Thelazia callipaeda TaxID=103827 RepID=A0A0N5D966_THECL|nr:unnamed protein product [Thelazia callipaeda]